MTDDKPKLAYTIAQARAALGGIGQATIYRLINDHELTTFKIYARTMIAADVLADFVSRKKAK